MLSRDVKMFCPLKSLLAKNVKKSHAASFADQNADAKAVDCRLGIMLFSHFLFGTRNDAKRNINGYGAIPTGNRTTVKRHLELVMNPIRRIAIDCFGNSAGDENREAAHAAYRKMPTGGSRHVRR